MKIFIWERVDHATSKYHSEGGLVVFADNETEARQLANATRDCRVRDNKPCDHIRDCADGPKNVFIFPDAGCC